MGLIGCMVGPDYQQPDPPATDTYTEEPLPIETEATPHLKDGHAQEFNIGGDIPEEWWTLFESPELNELIIHGLNNSPDLKAAEATLWQAQEDLRSLVGETMYPSVGLELDAGREQLSAFDSLEGTPGASLSDFPVQLLGLYNTNVNVAYVLDVFGGNRRAIEAMQANLDFEAYQLQATYLTLTSNIVTTAILEGSLRAQIKTTQKMIDEQTKLLNITEQMYQAGANSQFDVLAQETLLAQTIATLPPLEEALAQTRHALSVLVGDYPGSDMPKFYLEDLHLPRELPVSIPSELINQRPDIKAAEALLHQASAEVGIATANLLPTFPITASYGVNSDSLSDFFTANNIYWDWQASVLQPIFMGGALMAQRESAIAGFEIAFAQYQSTVLTGLQNVADSLSALEADAQLLHETARAEKAAKDMLDLTKKQYNAGAVDFLDLIYAETAYEQTALARINAQAARYADTAALFQALGGGWWSENESEDKDNTDQD
jgi:NodT family efflux transporter outer membrane factor (OMF) lipoprotein